MMLHQTGEVLHCDETGVLWVQLENKNKIQLYYDNNENGYTQDVSVVMITMIFFLTAELKWM